MLALRYKELFTPNPDGGENDPDDDVPYAVNSYLTTIDTADIDTDYMNSRFEKYLKIFYQECRSRSHPSGRNGAAQDLCHPLAGRAEVR